jgi:hypothetical protein
MVSIKEYASATQSVASETALSLGINANTNSALSLKLINLRVEANAGVGVNNGIYIINYPAVINLGVNGSALCISQQ